MPAVPERLRRQNALRRLPASAMRLATAARSTQAARRSLEPAAFAALCRWPTQPATTPRRVAAAYSSGTSSGTELAETGLFSFTADRTNFAEGLPDLVDHANLYNNPGIKHKWRREQASMPKDIALLRRKKAQLVIERLASAEAGGSLESLAPGMLLTGGAGSGKSMALLHIVQWAKTSGWLVCYVPNARQWTHGQYAICDIIDRVCTKTPHFTLECSVEND